VPGTAAIVRTPRPRGARAHGARPVGAVVGVVSLVVGMTALRAVLAARLPLLHDEAYYWLWARRLAWSYVDHPPVVAWLLALVRPLGDAEGWVRLPALALGLATTGALYLLARDLFDAAAGLRAVVLFQVAPVLGAAGLMMTPDAPMYLAWTVAMRLAWGALAGRPRWWVGAGVALGLAMLSKLYAVTLGIGVLAYVLAADRAWLRRREPYLAAALAALALAPVVAWNVAHDWAAVRFLVSYRKEIGAPPGAGAYVRLLTQHLPLVLFMLPAFGWALWAAWIRREERRWAFLFWTAVPAVAAPLLVAPLGAARGHWMGPAYLGLAVALAGLWRPWVTGLALANAAALAAFVAVVLLPWGPPVPGAREFYGWKEAGQRAAAEAAQLGRRAVLVADRYQVAAQLAYHTRDRIPVLLLPDAIPGSIWPPTSMYVGSPGVAVAYAPERFSLERCLDGLTERPPVTVTLKGYHIQEFRLFTFQQLKACR